MNMSSFHVLQKASIVNEADEPYVDYLQRKEKIVDEREKFKAHMQAFDTAHGSWMKRRNEEEQNAVAKEIIAHKEAGQLRDCWGVVRRGLAVGENGDDCERDHFVSSRTNGLKEVVYHGNLIMELWACLSLSYDPECFYYFARAIACAVLMAQRDHEGNYILDMLLCDEKQAMQAIENLLKVGCRRFWSRVRHHACWTSEVSSSAELMEG
eukprot:GHVU01062797.1.p1 GENE.GHVU01062797.1~~GHVU01062797.1.p1  ORF type:complete len:210 (-),score=25.67 GHVU01062797.1:626-1255(-)